MTQPGIWEPVHYNDLPDEIKKKSTSGRRVGESYTKIFSGKPHDYKVQYAVNQGTLKISYYRTAHSTFYPPFIPATVFTHHVHSGSSGYCNFIFLYPAAISPFIDRIGPNKYFYSSGVFFTPGGTGKSDHLTDYQSHWGLPAVPKNHDLFVYQ